MASLDLSRLNVLAVDDNRHMLTIVKSILYGLGIRNVQTAMDAADAFEELRHYLADIVICDWVMSPLDGIEFVRLIRSADDSPNRYVPIIMLTGHTEMHRVIEARDAGVTEFLAKPISPKSLYTRVHSIVTRPREFVRTKSYFGPDRRRHDLDFTGENRRQEDAELEGLSNAEVSQLLDRQADETAEEKQVDVDPVLES